MAILRVQTVFQPASGNPADIQMNTVHFEGLTTEADNACDMVIDFYNEPVASHAYSYWMAASALTGYCTSTAYDLGDSSPRAPIYSVDWELASARAGTRQAAEVSCVLSFEAAKVSGLPQNRRRNRIYLPTVEAGAIDDDGLFSGGFIADVAGQATAWLDASLASVNMSWVVYSPTNEDALPIVGGWVDDAPDIQRRRGVLPDARLTWEATP